MNKSPIIAIEKVYRTKIAKYEPLGKRCEEVFVRHCKLAIVINSSLGAVYKESVQELMKNIGLGDRIIKTLMRRISAGSIIRSFFMFNKFKLKSDSNTKTTNSES
jgi:hypothetical protein